MKKITIAILFLLTAILANAQKQKVNYLSTFDEKLIHFGFTLGVNTLDFDVLHYNPIGLNPDFPTGGLGNWPTDTRQIAYGDYVRADVAQLIPGFTVGIVSSLRLTQDLELRFLPGLSFGERQLTYNIDVRETDILRPSQYYSVKSTFLDFPLLIKYKARRINNNRPYIVFGPAYRQDISRTGKEDLVRLTKGGFYAEIGVGWDHYFTFFRFSAEVKMSIGLNNQISDAPRNQRQYYSYAIRSLKSNIFTLCFHFE